jgi:hypothetical protein
MNKLIYLFFLGTIFLINSKLDGQNNENCFLVDFKPDTAEIPLAVDAVKPNSATTVIVTLQGDTLGEISKYVFGNAIAAWAGAHDNSTLVEGVKLLAPTLIRFPGGSWSNGYFWKGIPTDVPDSIYDGTTYNSTTKTAKKGKFWGQTGKGGWQTTPDQYYALRNKTNVSQGLITINYGYARYGTGSNPVAQAAHLAADWVRYDAGRTKFWEIGNENGGPWEYGWMIDTALNQDGQPQIITGELYGKHFKVFVDSMKSAASQIGDTIYIGGQVVIDGPSSWNFVDRTWNEGFLKEAGNAADFYVIHNYFSSATNIQGLLNDAASAVKNNKNYMEQDIVNKNASPKPLAYTEYNIGMGNPKATTYYDGMQAVVLISEMIKNNFGLGARWLLASGDGSMFYAGSDANFLNHPHPDFYYLTYLQKFYGDHAISITSSSSDINCYASKYSSGETALVIVNKGTKEQVISLNTDSLTVGEKYYIYSFTGGDDNVDSLKNVYINGQGPSDTYQWGPYSELSDIKANSYIIDSSIKFTSPAKSVQMIMIEGGTKTITVTDTLVSGINDLVSGTFNLYQNYPNPFNASTLIGYQLPENIFVNLKVHDFLGRKITTLVNERQDAGYHSVQFNDSKLPAGIYFYSIEAGQYRDIKKLMIIK